MSDLNLTVEDGIARLQLNRPAVFNALSPGLLLELIDRCDELARDDVTKVVVLEGSGKHFCAGADLPPFTKRMMTDPHGTADLGRRAAEALAAIPQITIAAIKGYCIGGALVLSAACDLRIAADNSRFGDVGQVLAPAFLQVEFFAHFGWTHDLRPHPLDDRFRSCNEIAVRCQHTFAEPQVVFETNADIAAGQKRQRNIGKLIAAE